MSHPPICSIDETVGENLRNPGNGLFIYFQSWSSPTTQGHGTPNHEMQDVGSDDVDIEDGQVRNDRNADADIEVDQTQDDEQDEVDIEGV